MWSFLIRRKVCMRRRLRRSRGEARKLFGGQAPYVHGLNHFRKWVSHTAAMRHSLPFARDDGLHSPNRLGPSSSLAGRADRDQSRCRGRDRSMMATQARDMSALFASNDEDTARGMDDDEVNYPLDEDDDIDEFDDSDDEGYASDDPERWGPYYWSSPRAPQEISSKEKAWDLLKFASFKTVRNLNFAGEVLVHFFGLNNSPYQWIIDSLDKEERIRLEQAAIAAQQEALDPRTVVPSTAPSPSHKLQAEC